MTERRVYTGQEAEVTDEGDCIEISVWSSSRPRNEETEPDHVLEADYVWASGANTRPIDGGGYARIAPHGYIVEVMVDEGSTERRRGRIELVSHQERSERDYISSILDDIDKAMGEDEEARKAHAADIEVDIGYMSTGINPEGWLDAADAIASEYGVTDEEFNRALGNVLDPDLRGEPTSNLVNPARSVPMQFACSLMRVVLEVPPDA